MERTALRSMGDAADYSLSCSVHFRIWLPGFPPVTVQHVVNAQSVGGVARATVRNDAVLPPEDIMSTGVAAPNPLDLLLQLVGASSIVDLVAHDLEMKMATRPIQRGG